jgi:hypothetical protein
LIFPLGFIVASKPLDDFLNVGSTCRVRHDLYRTAGV